MRVFELFEAGIYYRGYPCTKDCSGHEAGYNYAAYLGLDDSECPYGSSNSFWEGCISFTAPGDQDPQKQSTITGEIIQRLPHRLMLTKHFANNLPTDRQHKRYTENNANDRRKLTKHPRRKIYQITKIQHGKKINGSRHSTSLTAGSRAGHKAIKAIY